MIFIIKEQCMDCLSKKLFKHFKTYYGKKINACEKDFYKGDFKFIIVSLTRTLTIAPEEFLNVLLISSANIGNDCFKDNQEEKLCNTTTANQQDWQLKRTINYYTE